MSTLLHAILDRAPAPATLAQECKGCHGTLCKGCHGTEHAPGCPGEPSSPTFHLFIIPPAALLLQPRSGDTGMPGTSVPGSKSGTKSSPGGDGTVAATQSRFAPLDSWGRLSLRELSSFENHPLLPGEQRIRSLLRFGKIWGEPGHPLEDRFGLVRASLLLQSLRQQQVSNIGGLYGHRAGVLADSFREVAIFLRDQAESDHSDCHRHRPIGC